jgi:hypothetical protein
MGRHGRIPIGDCEIWVIGRQQMMQRQRLDASGSGDLGSIFGCGMAAQQVLHQAIIAIAHTGDQWGKSGVQHRFVDQQIGTLGKIGQCRQVTSIT